MNKPWPWNSHYSTGAGAALLAVLWLGLWTALIVYLAVEGVWITYTWLRYRNQRQARQARQTWQT
jgi:Flp pilus assembly protein TadB